MSRTYDRDPYAILRVFPNATDDEVKEAYYKLARRYHPDVNTDPRAVERMKDINWAYNILSDPQERAEYDLWRSQRMQGEFQPGARSPHPTGSAGVSSPSYPPVTNNRPRRHRPPVGRSQTMLFWLAMIILLNVILLIRPVLHHDDNSSRRNTEKQTTHIETLEYSRQTSKSAQGIPNTAVISTPSPIPQDGLGQQDLRSSITRGSWEWQQIHTYFPELTTLYGLSGEVTLVTYDQSLGYDIKTRGLGEYWIYIDPSTHTVIPRHSPPKATLTSQP